LMELSPSLEELLSSSLIGGGINIIHEHSIMGVLLVNI
jgi:hypothetical protein